MDVCIDPEFRGRRIGQRLYNERKKLCQHLRLKGVVFAGRMPNLTRRWNAVGSAENYPKLVLEGKQRDPVIGFQIRNASSRSACCATTCRSIPNPAAMPRI